MSFITPLFVQTDFVTFSGNPTVAFPLTFTPVRIGAISALNSSAVYRAGADYYITSAGSVFPQERGAIIGLPVGSQLIVTYLYAGSAPSKTYDYQIAHILPYGQSLSLGERGVFNYPSNTNILTTVNNTFGALMFSGGTRPLQTTSNQSTAYAALIPLVENNNNSNPTQCTAAYNIGTPGETPLSGMFDWMKTEAVEELFPAAGFNFLGSCPGLGGAPISTLVQGTTPYNRLLNEVTLAKALAVAASKSYGVPAVLWLQGEADSATSVASYQSTLTTLFTNLNTDIKAITGQSKNVQFFMYQTVANNPSIAQFNVAQAVANAHIAVPCYAFPRNSTDNTHLTAYGYRFIGAYFGRAIKRQVIDGVGWSSLKPISTSIVGSTIVLNTNSTAGLVMDSSSGVGGPTWGFSVATSGAVNVPVTGVVINSPTQLTITTSPAPVAGDTIAYGLINGGGFSGGGIRDQMGWFDRASGLLPAGPSISTLMHNWLSVFQITL